LIKHSPLIFWILDYIQDDREKRRLVIPVKTGIQEIKELLHIDKAQSSYLLDPGLNPG